MKKHTHKKYVHKNGVRIPVYITVEDKRSFFNVDLSTVTTKGLVRAGLLVGFVTTALALAWMYKG